ncbi:hypothetical protein QWJ34_19480 [Saccharibacillus sp. CPCC 101409]|uniref:hypothetical protein n=1 Tax=Saccharibacillus sp. CPCC 101409 TaxID=3058041 RepID=UPI002673C2AF|nr:hypothetical protein [Saccharibacillus sp. CPCC 101409]MDO3411953.1 hypothetical protein [Saccharibacillus sp. CPCC 101409]
MNSRGTKMLLSFASASLAVPLLLAPLPSAFSDASVYAAVNEAPAPMEDPVRAQLLYEIAVFKEGAELMTPSSNHGNLPPLFEEKYKNRIIAETTAIAQNESSTPTQLARALHYVAFSFHDFFDKGNPYTSYILSKMSGYFNMNFPKSDEPGRYSEEKVKALVDKFVALNQRLGTGEDEFTIYKEFVETRMDFYAHPNP